MITRYFKTETRAVGDSEVTEITGKGAVVGVTTDLGWCEEEIAVGAFSEADISDVLVCFNHDLDTILGRTSATTAEVMIDESGNLIYTANQLDKENPRVISPIRYIQRGEVNKSSFMFEIKEEIWRDSEKYGSYGKRVITKIGKVYETGPVTLPAYSETDSYAREKDSVMQSRSAFISSIPNEDLERDAEWRKYYELTVK